MFDTQLSLLATGEADLPPMLEPPRLPLGKGAWMCHVPEWLPGADAWMDIVHRSATWRQDSRPMYDRVVDVPRLIWWQERADVEATPLCDLSDRIAQIFDRTIHSVSANWYRDGADSVAMHRDKVPLPGDSLIVIVSLGDRRPFLLKADPELGGHGLRFNLGHGDLLVMGGTTQAFFQHGVPKVATAGSRISMMFRSV